MFDDLTHLKELSLRNYRGNIHYEQVSRNEFPTLPAGLFRGLPLTVLELAEVGLTELDPAWYGDLPTLLRVDLRGNALSTLPDGLLRAMPELDILELADNRLRSLPADLFAGFYGSLSSLTLQGNPGSPFALTFDLVRTRIAGWPAGGLALRLPQGAPRYLEFRLSASGAHVGDPRRRSATANTAIGSGETRSRDSFALAPDGEGLVVASARLQTSLSQGSCSEDTYIAGFRGICYVGIDIVAGDPLVLNGVPDRELASGERPWRIELADVFLDFDAAGTAYAAESDNPQAATATVEGGTLVVTPRAEGAAVVRIVATAADGRTAIRTFTVVVPAEGRPFLRGWRLSLLEEQGSPP